MWLITSCCRRLSRLERHGRKRLWRPGQQRRFIQSRNLTKFPELHKALLDKLKSRAWLALLMRRMQVFSRFKNPLCLAAVVEVAEEARQALKLQLDPPSAQKIILEAPYTLLLLSTR